MKKNICIILGLTPQGLSLLRILSRKGVDVVAYCNSKRNVGYYSKYGKKIVFDGIDDLKQKIKDNLFHLDYKPLCYITSGELLATVLRDFRELYDLCEVISSPYETIEMLAHKDRMYSVAMEKGFCVAPFCTLDKLDSFQLNFPIFVKRNYEISLFFKAEKINSQEEFDLLLSKIEDYQKKDILVQQFIDIPSENLKEISAQFYFCKSSVKGALIAYQTRKLKKGLTASLIEITDKKLLSIIFILCTAYMNNLEYTGFAEFEFMYDAMEEKLFFLEVNTRTCGEQSAMNHKFSNLADVLLNPFNAPNLNVKIEKLYWMNIIRDIRVRLQKRDFTRLGDIFRSKYDIFDIRDIKPFFRQIL